MSGQLDLLKTEAETVEAREHEFFRTPARIVHQLLDTARASRMDNAEQFIDGLPDGLWVDAGAGDGAVWRACRNDDRSGGNRQFIAVEKRPAAITAAVQWHGIDTAPYLEGDWLELHSRLSVQIRHASVVVMNSPFSLTHAFVGKAFEYCPNAWVWSLQRQSWGKPPIKDKARRAFILNHWPEFKLQCMGGRPSFDGKGTDTAEYIWYGWSPTGRNRRYCRYEGPCKER